MVHNREKRKRLESVLFHPKGVAMKITEEFLNKGRRENGGAWTKAQLEVLGISWPVQKRWRSELIDTEISDETAELFLSLKNPIPFEPKNRKNEASSSETQRDILLRIDEILKG